MKTALANHRSLVLICGVFIALGLLRLNDLSLSGDSCRYLTWASSLAHQEGFVDTTQLAPDRFVPLAPLYSVLMAPVEAVAPLSIAAAKAATLLWAVLALVLFYFWILGAFGKRAAVWTTLLLALNPATLIYGTEALSEAPFIALTILLLMVVERWTMAEKLPKGRFWTFVLLLSLLPLLREAGLALLVAVAVALMIGRRRARAFAALLAGALPFVLWYFRNEVLIGPKFGAQIGNLALITRHFVTPADSPIVNELALRIWIAVSAYADQIGGLIFYPAYSPQLAGLIAGPSGLYALMGGFLASARYVILAGALILVCVGVAEDLRRSRAGLVRALFGVFAMGAVCLYPAYDIRFLLPLLPLAFYYIAGGIVRISRFNAAPAFLRGGAAVSVAALIMVLPNLVALYSIIGTNLEYLRSPENMSARSDVSAIFRYQWPAVKKWIEENAPADAVIGSPVRNAALASTGKKIIHIDPAFALPVFDSFLRDGGVRYLLAPPARFEVRQYEFLMRESRRFWFEPIAGAPNLFRVHSRFRENAPPALSASANSGGSPAAGLLRKGRDEIMGGAYREASTDLHRALETAPEEADVLFQALHADLFLGDSSAARREYERLVPRPGSLSYFGTSRNLFDAADLYSKARNAASAMERPIKTYRAAAMYWRMGFYRRSSEIMDALLESDTTYFVGLLWGFHFDITLGDTASARRYLAILRNIDDVNPVVLAFVRFLEIGDSLKRAPSAAERSALHFETAKISRTMELFDESIDQAEMALRESDGNTGALMLLAQLYERRGSPWRAMEYYRDVMRVDHLNRFAAARIDSLRSKL